MVGLLVKDAYERSPADPPAEIDLIKMQVLGTAQNAQRPIGEFNDAIWEQAAISLGALFDRARARIAG